MIKEFISRITMIETNKSSTSGLFDDRRLKYYEDYYHQLFLAESRWSYRMRIK